jgi:hypothetical protein
MAASLVAWVLAGAVVALPVHVVVTAINRRIRLD